MRTKSDRLLFWSGWAYGKKKIFGLRIKGMKGSPNGWKQSSAFLQPGERRIRF